MPITLKDAEIVCVKNLAKLFESGQLYGNAKKDLEALGLTADNYIQVLRLMEHIGAIEGAVHTTGGHFSAFVITPAAVQFAREVEANEEMSQERKDIVELVRLTLRKHPVTAWAFIVFGALLFLVTALNQVVSLLKNLGAF